MKSAMEEASEESSKTRLLTEADLKRLEDQDMRLVSPFLAEQLEKNAKKNWDLFYKRNETRFFKDRHWTTREFIELIGQSDTPRTLLEVGCGVGNLIYPLLEDGLNFYFYACDLSPRAVEFVKSNAKYNENKMKIFQCDITSNEIFNTVCPNSIDVVTLIFVLSAIHPEKFGVTLLNIHEVLKPGGLLLFRDYGLHDMAQLRFKTGNKISENFYMRQDGTRSYYFSESYLESMVKGAGYEILENNYVYRKTVNIKENVNADRVFIQGKFRKCVTKIK